MKRDVRSEVCVLIPALNEEKSIGEVVRRCLIQAQGVLVMDDGSTDATAARAREAGGDVIRCEHNRGKGAVLREGFAEVLRRGWPALIVLDGDGQHEPESIPDFVRKAGEGKAGVVIGNRMVDSGKMPPVRRWTNRIMSSLLSKLIGQRIPDTQCGFRLISREVLDSLELTTSNYDTESEILLQAARRGFTVASVPIKTIYLDQESKIRPGRDTIRFFRLIFRNLIGADRHRK